MTGPRRPMGHSMQEFEAQGPFYFDTAGPRFRGLMGTSIHEAHLFVETNDVLDFFSNITNLFIVAITYN